MITEPTILSFYRKWCAETGRGGGVLIGSSIRELLTAFAEFLCNQNQPNMDKETMLPAEDRRLLASLDEEISRTWNNLLHAHDEHALGDLSARYN